MKIAVFTAPRQIEVREVDIPSPGPRQVLVKTRAVGLCTFERRFYTGSSLDSYPFRGGHEVSGEVVEVGSQAQTDVRPGDVVCLALLTRCGACYYCRRGMDNLCIHNAAARDPSQVPGPAGLGEYVIAEDYQVYKAALPPAQGSITQEQLSQLALAEPVACVIRSAQMPALQFGDTALVQGAGIMGLLHVLLLKRRGMRFVMSEPDERRQQRARQVGADWVVNPLQTELAAFVREHTDGYGANAAFFTAGGAPAIEQAICGLAKGGWLCLYGSVHPSGPVQVDPNYIHYNELVVTGTFSHTKASFQQAVAMIVKGQIDMSIFVSERVPFPQLYHAFERALSPETYRVVMTFDM
jgi:L-iditol 2-dehydrogenase